MGKPVVQRKIKKAEVILEQMSDVTSEEEFKELFIKMYPDDWERIIGKYRKAIKENETGKRRSLTWIRSRRSTTSGTT